MAFAAVTSLNSTLYLYLYSSSTSMAYSSQDLLRSANSSSDRLKETLKIYDKIKNSSEGVLSVEARIIDEAHKLEDLIDFEASAQFLTSQSQSHGNRSKLSLDILHLKHDISCFAETAKKLSTEYVEELYKRPPPHKQEVAAEASSTIESDSGDMVGLSHFFLQIRDEFIHNFSRCVIINGMAGIGKTTLARKLLEDSLVKKEFDCFAFVHVGQNCKFKDILRSIIAQVSLNVDAFNMIDEKIVDYFKTCLSDRKCLVVLDDVWEIDFLQDSDFLLIKKCSSLLTTRIEHNATSEKRHMPFLNEEESWELLRKKVFDEEYCPPQLIKYGKKIASNCEGLPLLILTVAKHLLHFPKNLDYWREVAQMKNSVFDDACDQIYEILISSYHYIDQASKACFLYMGLFPKNYLVRRSRIINLWCAERLAQKDCCPYILDKIVSNNLTVSRQYCFGNLL